MCACWKDKENPIQLIGDTEDSMHMVANVVNDDTVPSEEELAYQMRRSACTMHCILKRYHTKLFPC